MFANILSHFLLLSQCTLRWYKHALAGFRLESIVESSWSRKCQHFRSVFLDFLTQIKYKLYLVTTELHFYTWPLRPSNKTNKTTVTKLQQLKRLNVVCHSTCVNQLLGKKSEKLPEQYIVSNRRYFPILDCKRHVLGTALRPFGDSSFRYVRTRKIRDTSFSHAQNDYANFPRQLHI